MDAFLKEKMEILDGSRGRGTKAQAAVRRQELAPFLKLSNRLKSRKVDTPPTIDDYNALRDDVRMIHAILLELSTIQQR